MSPQAGLGAELASLAGRVRALAQANAAATPDARVRLSRPLEAPLAAADAGALLGLNAAAFAGGPKPQAPFAPNLAAFKAQISECQLCPLGAKRKHVVFGEGDPASPLVLVSAAPEGKRTWRAGPWPALRWSSWTASSPPWVSPRARPTFARS